MTMAANVAVTDVVSEPMPPVHAPAPPTNPLSASTAFFDLRVDGSEDPLYRGMGSWAWNTSAVQSAYRSDWRHFTTEIYCNLDKVGVPLGSVRLSDDLDVIQLNDWGEIRLICDDHGPRVLIRICVPKVIGVVVPFLRPDRPETLDRIMESVRNARRRAQGLSRPIRPATSPTTWTRYNMFWHGYICVSELVGWY